MNIAKTIIKFLGGYSKDEILNECVAKLYNTISVKDILREENGKWLSMDKPMNESTKQLIISEAKILQSMTLWNVLQNDIKYQANKRMFLDSRTETDLIVGKSWLFVLDAITTRLKSLDKEKGNFNQPTKA